MIFEGRALLLRGFLIGGGEQACLQWEVLQGGAVFHLKGQQVHVEEELIVAGSLASSLLQLL
ncbi:hypothetical protein GCM10007971_10290 [Oceanobacillus indicireducens]|uniref:Uncharacterized protein n=1 Tax=Oceanobacillus indicireducens TaxID=1004261 RepID=A0A918D090_9BACI|nr:hypothetical protein GCM10007971_10290 [Oceanobacillus indicireducens]